ncbi:MAG TPA: radical SAM protein [Bacteroidales bacterium]|nr:MAG: radical SAM protein [Bacteroidetes bacterium GWF2_33_38]OFY72390.1 MAG: radical SAM protein [Bacteroidetes bacterium RIFOXYA12_FULL_33_9]OFY89803.1 MAG: radical SAM protein [Bacteroidetes bacterium RIFOXYA2_FULL_33_7]HBF89105.1 radical SAM protein [Bacteroidales bacterium]
MATFLFDKIIFGPVKSRRLGISLGINLLPLDVKYCNFDCVYCECGWSDKSKYKGISFYKKGEIIKALDEKLSNYKKNGESIDVITFAGNGEPTLHPQFSEIIDETIAIKNKYFADIKISVLSNATMLHKEKVFEALKKVDMNILKLDSGIEKTINIINRPQFEYSIENIIQKLSSFNGNVYIQTMFLKSLNKDFPIDNTSKEEIDAWLEALKKIKPKNLMIYSLDRETPASGLVKISLDELNRIADKARELNINVIVSG